MSGDLSAPTVARCELLRDFADSGSQGVRRGLATGFFSTTEFSHRAGSPCQGSNQSCGSSVLNRLRNRVSRPFVKTLPQKLGTRPANMYPFLFPAPLLHRGNAAVLLHLFRTAITIALWAQCRQQPWVQRRSGSRQRLENEKIGMGFRVRSLADFARVLVLDRWACNCDGRQAVFSLGGKRSRGYLATFIDQGYCFNAGAGLNRLVETLYRRRGMIRDLIAVF